MIKYENIKKLEDLKRAAFYNKSLNPELKLLAFSLDKEIEKDEKHNIEYITSVFKKTNATYFCITETNIHTDTVLHEKDMGNSVLVRKTWRNDSVYTLVEIESKYSYDLSIFKKKTKYTGLYVREGEKFVHYKKRKDILNYYFSNNWIATANMIPFRVESYGAKSFIDDLYTTLNYIEQINNIDLIVTNLKVIRRYIKIYNWKNKKDTIEAIKKYAKLK